MMRIMSDSTRLLISACAKSHLSVALGEDRFGHGCGAAVAPRHSIAALAAERSMEKLQDDYWSA
jgi:hypothetical protein